MRVKESDFPSSYHPLIISLADSSVISSDKYTITGTPIPIVSEEAQSSIFNPALVLYTIYQY
jgi:hypothetical protein